MSTTMKEMAAQLRRMAEAKASAIRDLPDFSELLELHRGLNAMENALGEPATPLGEFFGIAIDPSSGSGTSRGGAQAVRVDEFFNMDALDAAKTYLKKHRDARSFQEIVTAVRSGGAKVTDEDGLRKGLGRSTLDIVKFGDHYGWLENYPDERAKRTKGLGKKSASATASDEGAKKSDGSEPGA